MEDEREYLHSLFGTADVEPPQDQTPVNCQNKYEEECDRYYQEAAKAIIENSHILIGE